MCNFGAFWGKPLRPQGRSHLGSPGIPVYDHEPVPWFPIDAHNPHPPYPLPVSSLSRETESERKINYALIIRFQFGIKRQENEFSYEITRLVFDACHISWVHFIPIHSTKWMVHIIMSLYRILNLFLYLWGNDVFLIMFQINKKFYIFNIRYVTSVWFISLVKLIFLLSFLLFLMTLIANAEKNCCRKEILFELLVMNQSYTK